MVRTQDDDDPFIKGEFDVIKELLEKIPEAKEGKRKVTGWKMKKIIMEGLIGPFKSS